MGEYVQYDPAVQLIGPQRISHDATVDHAHIAYNRLMSFGSYFQLEPSIGIAHDEVNIDSNGTGTYLNTSTTSSNTTVALRQTLTGITLGIIPRWYFNHYFAIEIPVRFGVGYSSRTDSANGTFSNRNNGITELINPSLVFCPSKNVALSVGYVDREQHVETDIAKSNLDLSFRGVSAALRVTF